MGKKQFRSLVFLCMIFLGSSLLADQEDVVKLRVKGLGCPFCAYGIDKRLQKIEGVESVKVDLKTGQVLVKMKPGMSVSNERLKEAIREGGFTATEVVQSTES